MRTKTLLCLRTWEDFRAGWPQGLSECWRGRCEPPVVSELALHQKKRGVFVGFSLWHERPAAALLSGCGPCSYPQVRSHLEELPAPGAQDNRASVWGMCIQTSTVPAVCVNAAASAALRSAHSSCTSPFCVWTDALLCLKDLDLRGGRYLGDQLFACWSYHQAFPGASFFLRSGQHAVIPS